MLSLANAYSNLVAGPEATSRAEHRRATSGKVIGLARDMGAHTREALLRLGFTFPKDEGRDRLLIPVELPEGWSVRRTDHYMYSDLVDPQGRKRGSIGYKSTLGDHWASFYLIRRFDIRTEYSTSKDIPGGMPPSIARLQVTERVRREKWPERRQDPWNDGYGPGRMFEDEDGGVYFMDITGRMRVRHYDEPKPIVTYETVVRDTFNPFKNPKHARLPYIRYYVVDNATGERLWTGKWLTNKQRMRLEGSLKPKYEREPHPEWTGAAWLDEHFPGSDDLLAHW